jgi:hypothetical protein
MTTKTMHIGLKQREVVLPNVEELDFETYKKSICMHEAGEKYTPKRQQNLTQAQRTAKAEVMRANALGTNAKIHKAAQAYQAKHGVDEHHWWCEVCGKAVKKDSMYTHNRSQRHFRVLTRGAPATPRSKMSAEQLKEHYKQRYNNNKKTL